jgi:hypothetical protein
MSFTYALGRVRTSAAGNPITFSYTVAAGDTVLGLLLNIQSATSRAGAAPSWNGANLTQANSTQKAVTTPEASCEAWYLINPTPATGTFTIPNTGALTIFATVVIGRSAGGVVTFVGANGGNGTSANPSPGAVTVNITGSIGFAVTAGGWQSWSPSAQVGTVIANTDDGATGGGEQYILNPATGSHTLSWTFATSDDWGAVSMYFQDLVHALEWSHGVNQPVDARWRPGHQPVGGL